MSLSNSCSGMMMGNGSIQYTSSGGTTGMCSGNSGFDNVHGECSGGGGGGNGGNEDSFGNNSINRGSNLRLSSSFQEIF